MSDADKSPLIFVKSFGALRPANQAAERALKSIGDGKHIKAKITAMSRNQRRRAWYWVMLAVAAEALADKTGDPWDAELLHDELKRVLRLGTTFTTPSGREVFKPRSTSDRAMAEPERAAWTDRCANVLSTWIGVPIADFMEEARAQGAQYEN